MRLELKMSVCALVLVACASEVAPQIAARRDALDGGSNVVRHLSPTRQLRRLFLTVRGKEPAVSQYQAASAAANAGSFSAYYSGEVSAALSSSDFYDEMVLFGRDYLRIGDYKRGSAEGGASNPFKGNHAVVIESCPAGTLHAGAFVHFSKDVGFEELPAICGDAAQSKVSVEPWWAPGTTVQVLGRAKQLVAMSQGKDCGRIDMVNSSDGQFAAAGCGCGPNLVYCIPTRRIGSVMYPAPIDSNPSYLDSQRRMLFEEPARLFAHIATTDAPFSDLITGDYTVAPRRLQHMYVRWGRTNSENAALDTSSWWRSADDTWKKVKFSTLHPNLLDSRTYQHDPRVNLAPPSGIPSAGVLTQLGPNSWNPRERVRAARYLETFACKLFSAPDPSVVFTPAYTNDPARQGACQHCHKSIDPAAIHFKRLEIEDTYSRYGQGHANLGGIGVWQWRLSTSLNYPDANSAGGKFWFQPYGRWNNSFLEGTFLTPVAPGGFATNEDARFIDYLPQPETLLGQTSDGTIGPLGFGKLVLQSGAFDRCAVQKIFERVMGRSLDITREAARETELVNQFVAGNRRVKPFIESLVLSDEFARGL
jgi:hypothetical protein